MGMVPLGELGLRVWVVGLIRGEESVEDGEWFMVLFVWGKMENPFWICGRCLGFYFPLVHSNVLANIHEGETE